MEKNLKPRSNTARKKITHDSTQKGHEEEETRPWSNLPNDILYKIISRLCFIDRHRCQAVCKGWRLPPNHRIKHVKEAPWLMTYKWVKNDNDQVVSKCKLYRPFSRNQGPYIIEDGITNTGCRESFVGAYACVTKFGWVLFCNKQKEGGTCTSFFLYTPFGNEVIKLPDLDANFDKVTFSSTPNSPECVFFVIEQLPMKSITINTCRLSDKSWQTHEFRVEELLGPIRDVVYIDGNFYCLFGTYTLATFNPTHKELCLFTKLRPPEYHGSYHLIPHLFDSHGKLFVAYNDRSDPFPVSNGDSINIIKFNRSQRAWGCKQSLKNHSLFLSCNSFSIRAVGKARKLANKVFYNDEEFNGVPYFMSMEDHYSTCDPNGFRSYEDEYAKEGLKSVWILPPQA